MLFLSQLAAALLAVTSSAAAPPEGYPPSGHAENQNAVRLLYQYPVGQWIENIAIRESGELLLTLLYSPTLDQLNPFETNPQPKTIATFPAYTSLSGIDEIKPDVFAIGVGNTTSDGPVSGSWSLWKTDLNMLSSQPAKSTKITKLSDIQFPNGICSLPSTKVPRNILTSDVKTGKIWRVNTTTGKHEVVVDNNLTAAVPDPVYGVSGTDGIRIQGNKLYFANAGTGVFASIPINIDGTPAASAKVVNRIANASTGSYDDFALQGKYAYLANARGNSIDKVALDGSSKSKVIAGNINSTEIAQPTSAAFGRTAKDLHILYVVTAGGLAIPVNGNEMVGAQVLAIDTTLLG